MLSIAIWVNIDVELQHVFMLYATFEYRFFVVFYKKVFNYGFHAKAKSLIVGELVPKCTCA